MQAIGNAIHAEPEVEEGEDEEDEEIIGLFVHCHFRYKKKGSSPSIGLRGSDSYTNDNMRFMDFHSLSRGRSRNMSEV